MKSDVGAALTACVFKYGYPSLPGGSYPMVAGSALVISALARIIPSKVSVNIGSLTEGQKNQIAVAILGGAYAAYLKKDPMTGAIGYAASDSLAGEILSILGMADASLFGA